MATTLADRLAEVVMDTYSDDDEDNRAMMAAALAESLPQVLRHEPSNITVVVFDMTEGIGAFAGTLTPDSTNVTFEKSDGWRRQNP